MTAPPLQASPGAGAPSGSDATRRPGGADVRPPSTSPTRTSSWRQWRIPLTLIALIVLGGVVSALISRLVPPQPPNTYLDPASSAPDGSRALSDMLGERGFTVVRADSAASALAALGTGPGSASSGREPATLVITSPFLLTSAQRIRLGHARADLFLVEPGPAALAALAPEVGAEHNSADGYGRLLLPQCDLAAARLAGSANLGGYTYRAPASAARCYPVRSSPSMVRYATAQRTITILGGGAPLTNVELADNGNAALMLNLLSGQRRIVWLIPEPPLSPKAPIAGRPGQGGRPGPALIPWAAWLIVIQLAIATVLVAAWRARRLGPLITERLPVVVRASETVEGHGRLYQSRRARGRAAAALRGAMLRRVVPALGLVMAAPGDAVTAALADRSRLGRPEITRIVYGPAPTTDAELVTLARSLDQLEREVRAQ
jgi:Domain of unknown function (DUF4350)